MEFVISRETSNLLKFISCWMVAISHYATYQYFTIGDKSLIYNVLQTGGGTQALLFSSSSRAMV